MICRGRLEMMDHLEREEKGFVHFGFICDQQCRCIRYALRNVCYYETYTIMLFFIKIDIYETICNLLVTPVRAQQRYFSIDKWTEERSLSHMFRIITCLYVICNLVHYLTCSWISAFYLCLLNLLGL